MPGPGTSLRRFLFTVLLLIPTAGSLAAQDAPRADSAAVLLRAARLLEARGETRLARELLRVLAERFPETREADLGIAVAGNLAEDETLTGFSRAGFTLYHTGFGAWLGIAVPAAFGANGPEPFGAGLLIGAPLGFFASRAWASGRDLTSGQAALLQFASTWGTWQGLGWQEALNIGDGEFCFEGFCSPGNSDTAPWVAAILGGVGGLGAGILATRSPVSPGTASLISHSAMWAGWYGLAAAIITGAEGDDILTVGLIGGNLGLLAAVPGARAWRPTAARVRTISAAGLAGGLAGLGFVLLTDTQGGEEITAMVAAGSTVGLVAGVALSRDRTSHPSAGVPSPAALSFDHGWRVNLPMPVPALVAAPSNARRTHVPGVRLGLLDVRW